MALPINIEDLLRQRKVESSRIEFKEGWNPERIYRTIGAFANDFDNIGGGYILVGVEEENGIAKRPVKGLPLEQLDRIQKEMQQFNNQIEPYYLPRPSIEEVDGKFILVRVSASTLAKELNTTPRTIQRDLKQMQTLKIIIHEGSDKGGLWKVKL